MPGTWQANREGVEKVEEGVEEFKEGGKSGMPASGFVSGQDCVGGLAGTLGAGNEALVSDAYADCNVSGNNTVGGMVGHIELSASIVNAYAVGSGNNGNNPGGLVGVSGDGTHGNVVNSLWNTDVGPATSQGGTGKTTTEMMQQTTFEDWNFDGIWGIKSGATYPYLQWEPEPDLEPIEEDIDSPEDDISSSSSSGCFVETLKSGK